MNVEAEVDQLLASWDERLKRVDDNLIALESEPTYELLAGVRGAKTALDGVTRHRVEPALAALGELFEHRARLTEVVTRAKEIRASLNFWDRDQKLVAIRELLDGPSIKLTGSPKPLAQRSLLDASGNDVVIVPDRLLEWMSNAYLAARDVVTAVSVAWAKLEPVIEGAEGELATLKTIAEDVGVAGEVAPELAWLLGELDRVRARISKDPLGVSAGIDSGLTPRLSALRHHVHELKAKKNRVTTGLRDAAVKERQADEAHQAALEALARAKREVTGVDIPPASDAMLLLGLAPWREKLEKTATAGRFGSADVGLARWNETVHTYLAHDRAVVERVEAALRERTELGGRLSARRAQLDALTAASVVAPTGLVERGLAIEALLRIRPTDLAHVALALQHYETEVVALAARARRG
jgi:hypothetical protein